MFQSLVCFSICKKKVLSSQMPICELPWEKTFSCSIVIQKKNKLPRSSWKCYQKLLKKQVIFLSWPKRCSLVPIYLMFAPLFVPNSCYKIQGYLWFVSVCNTCSAWTVCSHPPRVVPSGDSWWQGKYAAVNEEEV